MDISHVPVIPTTAAAVIEKCIFPLLRLVFNQISSLLLCCVNQLGVRVFRVPGHFFFRFFLWVEFLFLRLVVFSYRYIHLYDLLESIARRLEWTLRFVFQQDEGSPSVRKSELVHWSSLSNLRNDRVRALSAELSWTHGGLAYYLHGLAKLLSFIFVSLLTDRREHKSFCPRESLWSNDIRKSLRKEYLRLWTFSFFIFVMEDAI